MLPIHFLNTSGNCEPLGSSNAPSSELLERVMTKRTRLRVAVVSDALYPWHKGGKEVRYLHLLTGLPQQGMDVDVYSMKWWDHNPEVIHTDGGSLTYHAICPRIAMYQKERRSIFQAIAFSISTLRLLTRKFDVIEADHMPFLQLIPLRFVAWLKRVPLVVTWNEVWGKERWRSCVIGSGAALIEHICTRLPDAIISISSGTAEKLVGMGVDSNDIFVVPVALDLEGLRAAGEPSSAPELLFVGRLIEHKHADLAVEATRILCDRGYDVHLGVVGVGPEYERLLAQVEALDLVPRLTFYSTVESQQELWSLIRGSKVVLAPSVREGLGLVVAESLALGTPVICAIHPENESANLLNATTGSLVPAFSAEALADAAEFWLNDDSRRSDRIENFMAAHEELTVGAMSASYAEILRNAVNPFE